MPDFREIKSFKNYVMKNEQSGVLTPASKKEIKYLIQGPGNTASPENKHENVCRSFGTMDLWNIQKSRRSGMTMLRRNH
jgi:hypothetical protein